MLIITQLTTYLKMTLAPVRTFTEQATKKPRPVYSVGLMLLFRVPVLWVTTIIYYIWLVRALELAHDPPLELQDFVRHYAASSANDIFLELKNIPLLPQLETAWPWIGLFALLVVVGIWMHNSVWDHTALWMLGGTKSEDSFKTSCTAIADVMGAATYGTLLGLIATLPFVGLFALPLLGIVNIYYWILRGIGLSIYHGCPIWKGVVATILHVLLVVIFYGLLIAVVIAAFAFIALRAGL
ncbi:MAG: hypothetical protein FWG02_05155 [Holophagaceae bacterium]|nr:hypothetical protein [Holophagaceae bacterium]